MTQPTMVSHDKRLRVIHRRYLTLAWSFALAAAVTGATAYALYGREVVAIVIVSAAAGATLAILKREQLARLARDNLERECGTRRTVMVTALLGLVGFPALVAGNALLFDVVIPSSADAAGYVVAALCLVASVAFSGRYLIGARETASGVRAGT